MLRPGHRSQVFCLNPAPRAEPPQYTRVASAPIRSGPNRGQYYPPTPADGSSLVGFFPLSPSGLGTHLDRRSYLAFRPLSILPP
jgi:hypothetical protein